MLKAKTMSHSWYGILRKQDFMNDVINLYNMHKQSGAYNKTLEIILDRNLYKLENELLYNTFDMMLYNVDNINYNKKNVLNTPILYTVMNSQWNDATKLYYNTMLHFDTIHEFDRKFVKKYLSHPNIVASNIKHEIIVKSPYFVNKRADWLFGVQDGASILKSKKGKGKTGKTKKKNKIKSTDKTQIDQTVKQ